jgi:hypothetical protein
MITISKVVPILFLCIRRQMYKSNKKDQIGHHPCHHPHHCCHQCYHLHCSHCNLYLQHHQYHPLSSSVKTPQQGIQCPIIYILRYMPKICSILQRYHKLRFLQQLLPQTSCFLTLSRVSTSCQKGRRQHPRTAAQMIMMQGKNHFESWIWMDVKVGIAYFKTFSPSLTEENDGQHESLDSRSWDWEKCLIPPCMKSGCQLPSCDIMIFWLIFILYHMYMRHKHQPAMVRERTNRCARLFHC